MRPPLKTAELHAYNFGSRAAAAQIELAALLSPSQLGLLQPFGAAEERAESELGTAGFSAWAVRGWLESNEKESLR